jgi:ribonucleoside-diphosphate reductase alpha chain
MRVMDPAWIGMKLRKLLNVGEPLGHFMAPGAGRAPPADLAVSTVAYIARLVIHRYAMLGVLDEAGPAAARDGHPGLTRRPLAGVPHRQPCRRQRWPAGKACPECGNHTLIHKDGCEFCTACGFVGQCG